MTENRDVVIPETVAFGDEQHRVTAIKAYAFSSALITSIVIKLPSQHAVSDSVGCYNVGGAVCRPERSGVYLVRQSDGSFKKMKL